MHCTSIQVTILPTIVQNLAPSFSGYTPYKITHSSDYLKKLYDLAVDLICHSHAYIWRQKSEELKGPNPPPAPLRDSSIEESLQLFEVELGSIVMFS